MILGSLIPDREYNFKNPSQFFLHILTCHSNPKEKGTFIHDSRHTHFERLQVQKLLWSNLGTDDDKFGPPSYR